MQLGGHPPHREKRRSGLAITDDAGRQVFNRFRPRNIYRTFEDIPSLLVKTLLFIENRQLLQGQGKSPTRNPAETMAREWE